VNERLREFERASGLDIFGLGARREKWVAALEKYAALVAKDCADICDKIYFDNYPDAEDWERSQEGDAIKQHFGVKE
jgi:hypothetical protein